jgi:rfaE bifunctional protein nucleotidyltransferase chain/domain
MTHSVDPRRKILTQDELIVRQGRPRESRLVFTNGVFDLLHPGHVSYLAQARALGDLLVVAVNTDTSARRLSKGPDRPLVSAADRGFLLAALECVDLVTFFDEDTPRDLIARLLPDVLVKGGDYTPDGVAGAQEVAAAGGLVRILPFLPGYSTTDLVRRIRSGSID